MIPTNAPRKKFGRKAGDLDKRESSIERRACQYAKSLGYWHAKLNALGQRSLPDRLFKHPHTEAFAVEFKAKGKGPTELQAEKHVEMRAAGWVVYVCDSYEDAKKILDAHCL